MTLVPQAEMLARARSDGYAIGSFNVINTDTLLGAIDAAEELRSPVIIAVTNGHFDYVDLEALAPSIVACAERASVPVGIHFDHATTIGTIARALRCGFTSVMYDGEGGTWEQKIEETKTVVEMAHALGAVVEAALSEESKQMTANPTGDWPLPSLELVEEYTELTGVDVIAIGEGSSELDQDKVAAVAGYDRVYSSLHGGSQLPDEEVAKMVSSGLAKCSVYSKLARGGYAKAEEYAKGSGGDLLELGRSVREGFAAATRVEIERLGSANRV